MNPDLTKEQALEALETYFQLMTTNGASRIFHTAADVKIFDNLAAGPATAGQLAEMCGLKETPVQLLLEGLESINVLTREDGAFSLTPVMRFLAGGYESLGDQYWQYLPEFLRTAKPLARMDSPEQGEQLYRAQVESLDRMMKPSAFMAAKIYQMGGGCKGPKILDVGAGSAVWSLTIAEMDADAHVTAIDRPSVLEVAMAKAELCGAADRFTPMPGDYHEVSLEDEAYDLIIVANVTHIETPDGNNALMKKLYPALKPKGLIAVIDVMPGDKGRCQAALYAIGLALRTENGRVYKADELKEFVSQAGFSKIRSVPLQITPHTMGMIVASK